MSCESIRVGKDYVYLHYEGFIWNPGGGENGYDISDFVYKVDIGFVIELLEKIRQVPLDERTLPFLVVVYKDQILDHFFDEAHDYAIEQYKNGGDEEPIC